MGRMGRMGRMGEDRACDGAIGGRASLIGQVLDDGGSGAPVVGEGERNEAGLDGEERCFSSPEARLYLQGRQIPTSEAPAL